MIFVFSVYYKNGRNFRVLLHNSLADSHPLQYA